MPLYTDILSAIKTSLNGYFSPMPVVKLTNDGNPEPTTPYITVDILQDDQIGGTHEGSRTDSNRRLRVAGVYRLRIRFEGIGDSSGLIKDLEFGLNSPILRDRFSKNKLSYSAKTAMRRLPKLRETKWINCLSFDVEFFYSVEDKPLVDTIEHVQIEATYNGAVNDPMENVIDINPYVPPPP